MNGADERNQRGATRRDFLIRAAAAGAVCAGAARGLRAEPPPAAADALKAKFPPTWQSREFLAALLDPELNLLPEYAGAKVYWLFHDNYLAAKVLEASHPEIAAKVRAAVAAHGVTRSGKIEIVFNEAPDALPFRHYELADVAKIGDKIVRTERVKEGVMKGWEQYADLRFLAALAKMKSDPRGALADHDAGWAMWDGMGFRDRVLEVNGRYATYKLALAILASARLKKINGVATGRGGAGGGPEPAAAEAMARMLALRNELGGWITDYKPDGKPVGLANVETTSLCVLALEEAQTGA